MDICKVYSITIRAGARVVNFKITIILVIMKNIALPTLIAVSSYMILCSYVVFYCHTQEYCYILCCYMNNKLYIKAVRR